MIRKLTNHFTLGELTHTDFRQYDNTPPDVIIANLERMAQKLEEVRELLGHPIHITSCFRSKKVNDAVGSKETSKHREGMAADFKCPAFGSPLKIVHEIADSGIDFDQLILEFYNPETGGGWVHLGLASKNRRQILTINSHGCYAGIHP